MNKKIAAIAATLMLICTASQANAFKLSDLFGNNTGETVGNLIEGVFTTSNINVADMAGQWTVDGSAVSFQSENFLAKAGGLAATAAIKSKLDPYYKQYGLTGAVLTIQPDGTFTFQRGNLNLSGTITKEKKGDFQFKFQVLGGINIGKMKAYVQKSPQSMDIMFDASKLKSLLNVAASVTGSKLASSAVSILDSYDGICVGFGLKKTGSVEGESSSGLGGLLNGLFGIGNDDSSSTTTPNENSDTSGSGLGSFFGSFFGGGQSQNNSNTNTNTNSNSNPGSTNQEEGTSIGLDALLKIMGIGTGK